MSRLRHTLGVVVDEITAYRQQVAAARVTPSIRRGEVADRLPHDLAAAGVEPDQVIAELIEAVRPGLMGSTGPRYFGFVVGGSVDAALAADMLAAGWDQVAFNEATSPAAVAAEDVAGKWLKQLLGIPESASVGFVTGGQAANTVGLAAARWQLLRRHGWDVGRDGLYGAPELVVIAGEERHATIDRAVRLLGLGERCIVPVRARSDGAMDDRDLAARVSEHEGRPIAICAQSGNVNTGAFDDLTAVTEIAGSVGAWVHVDGAFGLWAAASPRLRGRVAGIERADSWACDGHKWLNVPYDVGYAFCAHPDVHATAMAYTAAYLTGQVEGREFGGGDFVPESSRRARGFATWAALRQLGRNGVSDLVDRCCALARRLAELLDQLEDVQVVNDVVLNQILVRVGDEATTDAIARWIQADGRVWLGATTWRGERLLRISVSNWQTDATDVEAVAGAVADACRAVRAG